MVFFTRQLYNQVQEGSGAQRRAENLWYRSLNLYHAYLEVISPLLPKAVLTILNANLHDGIILDVDQEAHTLRMMIDATHTDGHFRGKKVQLEFTGVESRPPLELKGGWWLYEEAHLRNEGLFALQVLCRENECEIVAKSVRVTSRRL